MIQEKAFYLKIRKQGVRWGCSCCQPVGRQVTSKAGHLHVKRLIKSKRYTESKLIEEIESE